MRGRTLTRGQRQENGLSTPGLVALPEQKRHWVPREPAYRPQRNVADDARDSELGIFDQCAGQRFISRNISANEPSQIVDVAGDLPALGQLLDGGECVLDAVLAAMLLKGNFSENCHRPRQK